MNKSQKPWKAACFMMLASSRHRLLISDRSIHPFLGYHIHPFTSLSPRLPLVHPPLSSKGVHRALHTGIAELGSSRSSIKTPALQSPKRPTRIVIGITGATGTVYAIQVLRVLRDLGVETHLVISKWALATLKYETPLTESQIRGLSSHVYTAKDMSAPIASGSFLHDGMIVVPCSMKTLAAIRSGFCDDLISRAADVSLKEGRKLMLAVRETPLSDIHLDNMLFLRRAGAIVFPPVPAFYTRPQSLQDVINQSVGRMLDSFGIHIDGFSRWNGFERPPKQ
ncbi:hypothetical protein ACJZ2D_014960 [Fusarium nematophilum]